MTWRAWNGFSPSWVNRLSSSARGIPSKLSRSADMFTWPVSAREDLRRVEEESDLLARGIRTVRAVHDVALDALGEVRADGTGRGFLRIGGAHDIAVLRDRVLALEHLHDDRTGGHVAHKIAIGRALAMNCIEALRLLARQTQHARGDDAHAASDA